MEIRIKYGFSTFREDENVQAPTPVSSKDIIQGAAPLDKQKTMHLRRCTLFYVQITEHHTKA